MSYTVSGLSEDSARFSIIEADSVEPSAQLPPSTAGVTIGIPPARVGNEANFQLQEEYTRWEAVSPGSAEKIPMFHADFPGFTLKIVEHSRNLLRECKNWA